MPSKIFISYRRQDSGANVLGIGQYLEHEFGRKNVFVDVDMRAGTKFPKVLEQRLAECKVMLVLIGPDWLNAADERGQRRLDDPDDWVRLEIARALNREITVIPVRINGAELPLKGDLPIDMRGLLDHQAVSVTLAGFRNEMSGLVRDIRAIPRPRLWRRVGAIGMGLSALLIGFAIIQTSGLYNAIEHIRFPISSVVSENKKPDDIWGGNPGEWVMYEYTTPVAGQPSASHQFRPSSVKIIGDRVTYEARYPVISANATATEKSNTQPLYEVVVQVIDCKKSVTAMAERTVYNSAKEVISNFKWGNPSSFDLSIGGPIPPGSVINVAQHMFCNEQMRTLLLLNERIPNRDVKSLGRTARGDGDIFYGPAKSISNATYELKVMIKNDVDHPFTELFTSNITIVGLPRSFRYRADLLQLTCTDRKIRDLKWEHYDSKYNLTYVALPLNPMPVAAAQGSPFDLLLATICGAPIPKVQGTYEGTNSSTYANKGHGEQRISLVVEQIGSEVSVSFTTVGGGQGKGTGKLTGAVVEKFLLQSTAPDCPGSYEASIKFGDDTASWSFKGEDCGGPMEGQGTARRTGL
jgi:hypothetical protein